MWQNMVCAPCESGLWNSKRKTKQPPKVWISVQMTKGCTVIKLDFRGGRSTYTCTFCVCSLCFYCAAGLMSLGVPYQQFQLHTLTQQLKTFNDMISYQDLMKQIQSLRWTKLISLLVFDYFSFFLKFMSLFDFISRSHSAEPRAQITEDFIKRQEPVETENLKHQQRRQNTETQRYLAHYV